MTEGEGLLLGTLGGLGFAGILEFFSIDTKGLIIMTVFLILDFCFGLLSAKARGEKIESAKCERGLIKKMLRWLLPFIVAGGLAWLDFPGIHGLITTIMGIIIFSEFYSVIGHIYAINYGEKLPEMDAFKILINKLATWLKSFTNQKIDTLPKEGQDDSSDKEQN